MEIALKYVFSYDLSKAGKSQTNNLFGRFIIYRQKCMMHNYHVLDGWQSLIIVFEK